MTRTEITKVNENQTMTTFTGRLSYFNVQAAFTASFFFECFNQCLLDSVIIFVSINTGTLFPSSELSIPNF